MTNINDIRNLICGIKSILVTAGETNCSMEERVEQIIQNPGQRDKDTENMNNRIRNMDYIEQIIS